MSQRAAAAIAAAKGDALLALEQVMREADRLRERSIRLMEALDRHGHDPDCERFVARLLGSDPRGRVHCDCNIFDLVVPEVGDLVQAVQP